MLGGFQAFSVKSLGILGKASLELGSLSHALAASS